MNLDKLDRIVVDQDAYRKITMWADENYARLEKEDRQIPIHEGIVVLKQDYKGHMLTSYVHFKLDDEGMHLTNYDGSNNRKLSSTTINEVVADFKKLDVVIHDRVFEGAIDMVRHDLSRQFLLIMSIFLYMQFHREYVKVDKESKAFMKKAKGKQTASSKSRTVRLSRTIYTFDYTPENVEKRKYERYTESWGQRGFWRHYKSGKTVWIAEQTKGAKNKPVTPKTYKA